MTTPEDSEPLSLAESLAWLQERCSEVDFDWVRGAAEWTVEAYRPHQADGQTHLYRAGGPRLLAVLAEVRARMEAGAG